MTFSIAARCAHTGMLGVAVSTAVPGVGGLCPFVKENVGAIATQSWVNPYLGIDGLVLLGEGRPAADALKALIEADPGRDDRQVGFVDATGRSAAHTGTSCVGWCGHITGENFAAQGNMLMGEATVAALADSFGKTAALELPERLLLAMEAAQARGGDKRGRQSMGLKVFWKEAYPWVDLRVDEHPWPVAELRRVFEIARQQLVPFTQGMPTRANPTGSLPESFTTMLQQPPPFRPGGGGSAP